MSGFIGAIVVIIQFYPQFKATKTAKEGNQSSGNLCNCPCNQE